MRLSGGDARGTMGCDESRYSINMLERVCSFCEIFIDRR